MENQRIEAVETNAAILEVMLNCGYDPTYSHDMAAGRVTLADATLARIHAEDHRIPAPLRRIVGGIDELVDQELNRLGHTAVSVEANLGKGLCYWAGWKYRYVKSGQRMYHAPAPVDMLLEAHRMSGEAVDTGLLKAVLTVDVYSDRVQRMAVAATMFRTAYTLSHPEMAVAVGLERPELGRYLCMGGDESGVLLDASKTFYRYMWTHRVKLGELVPDWLNPVDFNSAYGESI